MLVKARSVVGMSRRFQKENSFGFRIRAMRSLRAVLDGRVMVSHDLRRQDHFVRKGHTFDILSAYDLWGPNNPRSIRAEGENIHFFRADSTVVKISEY